ncbi:unnamed protein product [Cylicostephanus goldi]|uniref:Uncharacterized protein n=1 Tax=Cylicostephanus goldi TaxID=71465 RepID=A0A3P6RG29_CYLGO|nr:unnamed protein product [Cylicostephanus goldi]
MILHHDMIKSTKTMNHLHCMKLSEITATFSPTPAQKEGAQQQLIIKPPEEHLKLEDTSEHHLTAYTFHLIHDRLHLDRTALVM